MPKVRQCCASCKTKMCSKQNLQIGLTLVGVVLGVTLGVALRGADLSREQVRYLAIPGKLFLRGLHMLVLPIIVSSVVCGFAGLKGASKGKLLTKTMTFYLTSSLLAALTGVLLSLAIKPGIGVQADLQGANVTDMPIKIGPVKASDAIYDLLMNLFPDNIFAATTTKYKTERRTLMGSIQSGSDGNTTDLLEIATIATDGSISGTNYLGIIMLSILFGSILSSIGKEGEVIIAICRGIFKLTSRLITMIMWTSPIGLAFLIAPNIIKVNNFEDIIGKLGLYVLTVCIGFLIHFGITLSLAYYITWRKNPYKFAAGMTEAILTMIGTASSSVTLPVTMRCVEENNKVDKRVTRFLLPIGATINMDGTALYEAVSAIFIAQLHGYGTGFGMLLTISLTATAASIGTAGVPMSSIITILMVLQACGLPTTSWYLLLSVDFFLARGQGIINILGDSFGAAIVARLSRNDFGAHQDSDEEMKFLGKPAKQDLSEEGDVVANV